MTIGICFGRNVCGSHCLQLEAPIYTIYQTVQICSDKSYRSRSDETQLNKLCISQLCEINHYSENTDFDWNEFIPMVYWRFHTQSISYNNEINMTIFTPRFLKSTFHWYFDRRNLLSRVKDNVYLQLSGVGRNISRYLFQFTSGTVDHGSIADARLRTLSLCRALPSVTIPPVVINA